MPQFARTGSRIRMKRLEIGMQQAALASAVEISPAYLNLIEHNKRRIGGKLLLNLARVLKADPSALSEGTETSLLATLSEAASAGTGAELARLDEFAGRYPGWANVMAAQHDRITQLEHRIASLTDRLEHDPVLSASLHEVLSSAAAIRSTASILAGSETVEPEWQLRFQRNLLEDAKRLVQGAESVVSYLGDAPNFEDPLRDEQDELEQYLAAHGYHLAKLEAGQQVSAAGVLGQYLTRYRNDAQKMPLAKFQTALAKGFDPVVLAEIFAVDVASVLRRIAAMPAGQEQAEVGLLIADGTGAITFQKPVTGFSVPTSASACPMWPLFQALLRSGVPVKTMLQQSGRNASQFLCYAIAQSHGVVGYDGVQVVEATMLLISQDHTAKSNELRKVGSSCHVCTIKECAARRQASVFGKL